MTEIFYRMLVHMNPVSASSFLFNDEMVGADNEGSANERAYKTTYDAFEWIAVDHPKHAKADHGMYDTPLHQH